MPTSSASAPEHIGGAAVMAQYIQVLKKDHQGNFVWLDAGDNFFGTWDSKVTQGKIMSDFFNKYGLHASTFGNHEFDKDFPMKVFLQNIHGKDADGKDKPENDYKYVVSNIFETKFAENSARFRKLGPQEIRQRSEATLAQKLAKKYQEKKLIGIENLIKQVSAQQTQELRRHNHNRKPKNQHSLTQSRDITQK